MNESYSALITHARDVGHAFLPPADDVNWSHLEEAYKVVIFLWQNMLLCYINFPANLTEEEVKVTLVEKLGTSLAKKQKVSREQKQLVLTTPRVHAEGSAGPSSHDGLELIEVTGKTISWIG